jgi:hypothetical protein
MNRHPALLIAALALLAGACSGSAPAPGSSTSGSAAGYRVFVESAGYTQRLSPDSRTAAKLPPGVLSLDGKQLFAAYGTTLRSFDPATGAQTGDLRLPDYYGSILGQSPSGSYLVLAEGYSGATRIAAVPSNLQGPVRSAMLNSSFTFDALSDDGASLFLVEHVSSPLDYRVRRYDLNAGRLDPGILVEKGASPSALMNGQWYASVPSSERSTVYSLYYGQSGPFVHELNLDGGPFPVVCVDLPGPRVLDPARQGQWALALDGSRGFLYAVNAAVGTVSRIDLNKGNVSSETFSPPAAPAAAWWTPVTQAQAKAGEGGSAALSADGKTLFASAVHGYVAIDTASLKLRGAYLTDHSLGSLAATPDGHWLLAVQDFSRLIRIGAADGRIDATLLNAGGPIEGLRVYPAS